MKFAVVDIETTGLYHQGHGITEVAVVHLDEDLEPRLAFHSMVNPHRDIPLLVNHLTGIGAELVQDAPDFADIAEPLLAALDGRVFVAHNVSFDYRFLEAAFAAAGRAPRLKRLCTMRYARKMVPGLKSYRLGTLCATLEVSHHNAHRAGGDALATADLLRTLLARDSERLTVNQLLAKSGHAAVLPAAIDPEDVHELPAGPGVYYLKDRTRRPLYIGKAKNLKKRVLSHFTASGSSRTKQLFQQHIAGIDHRMTPSEHFALLIEDAEIKRWWPRYNRAQKTPGKSFALVAYVDRGGKTRFALSPSGQRADALAWFHSPAEGRNWLYKASLEYGWDPSRAGLPLTDDFAADPNANAGEEARALDRFIEECRAELHTSYALTQIGADAMHFALVRHGKYVGYGTHPIADTVPLEALEERLVPAPDGPMIQAILRRMPADADVNRIDFD